MCVIENYQNESNRGGNTHRFHLAHGRREVKINCYNRQLDFDDAFIGLQHSSNEAYDASQLRGPDNQQYWIGSAIV